MSDFWGFSPLAGISQVESQLLLQHQGLLDRFSPLAGISQVERQMNGT